MAKVITRRPLSYYLELKYPILVYEESDGGYVAELPDLPGCFTQAETLDELMEMAEDAKRAWIEVAYEDEREIPLPRTESEYSGKFVVRVGASLHRRLALAADEEGISLNQYVVHLLAGRVDLGTVIRSIDAIGRRVASIEQAIYYRFGPIPAQVPTKQKGALVVTIGPRGSQKIRRAVAS